MGKNFLSLKDFELSMREDALTRAELSKLSPSNGRCLTLKVTGLCLMECVGEDVFDGNKYFI